MAEITVRVNLPHSRQCACGDCLEAYRIELARERASLDCHLGVGEVVHQPWRRSDPPSTDNFKEIIRRLDETDARIAAMSDYLKRLPDAARAAGYPSTH